MSTTIRGVFAGGSDPSYSNIMDYITIATTGNAADFGDLQSVRGEASSGHCDANSGL